MGNGGAIPIDTWNPARLLRSKLETHVTEVSKEKAISDGEDGSDVFVQTIDCHKNLRNVWIGAITNGISIYLNEILACDLDAIDFRYRVLTMVGAVLRAVDKKLIFSANYLKGHVDEFRHWLKLGHPEDFLVPVARTSGSIW